MKRAQMILIALLAVYSLSILSIEFRTSQDYVRNYLTDIEGPVHFFAVNTSLSAFLLGSTALIFAINTLFLGDDRKARVFYITQTAVFVYLGMDDRFLFHEWLGGRLGISDAFVLAALGAVEGVLLLSLGDLKRRSFAVWWPLLAASAFFTIMTFIDGFLPSRLPLRLSAEDLCKTWGGFCFFLFALRICHSHIVALKQLASSAATESKVL